MLLTNTLKIVSKIREIKELGDEMEDLTRFLKIMSYMPIIWSSTNNYIIIAFFNNETNKFEFISNNVESILGYHYSEMEGHDYQEFCANADEIEQAQKQVDYNLKHKKAVKGFDIWYRHKNGKELIYLRWDATPVSDGVSFCTAKVLETKNID